MIIDLSTVAKSVNKILECPAKLSITSFRSRLGDFPLSVKEPVLFRFCNVENAALHITAKVDLTAVIPCGRCLREVPTPICFCIDRRLRITDSCLADDEMEEPDYLSGFELDTDRLIGAEILVNWPMKVLCRDDCRGICRVCGKNLNEGACSCREAGPDLRMAAIADIFEKFKEV